MKHRYYIERVDLVDNEENNDIEIGSKRIGELILCEGCEHYLAGYCYVEPNVLKPTSKNNYCHKAEPREKKDEG